MRILITGAAGFIGSHLASHLAQSREHQLLGVDSLSDYYSVELKKLRVHHFLEKKGVDFKRVDLSDRESVEATIEKFRPERIYHLGAQAGIRLPVEKFHIYTESNLSGFSNILTSALRFGVKDFLYASSSSVYGDFAAVPLSENEINLRPTSFYGATKLSNEITARTVADKFPIRLRGLRYFTVYGPWGRPDMAYFRVMEALINDRAFQQFGDGTIKRDFTYVDDVVRSCLHLGNELENRDLGFSDIVNVGGGSPHSISEMILSLETLMGKKLNVEIRPSNSSDVKITHSDSTYLESLIGRHDFVKLKDGLDRFLHWAGEEVPSSSLRDWVSSSI